MVTTSRLDVLTEVNDSEQNASRNITMICVCLVMFNSGPRPRTLPSKSSLQESGVKSYPSSSEPSDHIMISADLELRS